MDQQRVSDVSYDFGGRVALVTGAARGIGRAHALGFARAGADVAICDVSRDRAGVPYGLAAVDELEKTAAEIREHGVRCLPVRCDVGSAEQVGEMAKQVLSELGRVDVLVNNAGVESIHTVVEMPEEAWDVMMETHLKGTFLCCKHIAPAMIDASRGKIICTGSTLSVTGAPSQAHYATVKHGLVGFARSLAIELGPHGINVNVVCPGNIDTPMSRSVRVGQDDWAAQVGAIGGRWNLLSSGEDLPLQPEDVTGAVLWLASDAAAAVTGTTLFVDTGFTIK
jgi:NAD(P)-dependent dehydrogenase (short-subunit alcohol dehydrogenase family)